MEIDQVQPQFVGFSDGTETTPVLARYGIRMNQFGQVLITEGTVVRGIFGNYNTASFVEILLSQAGAIEYYVNSVRGALVLCDAPPSYKSHMTPPHQLYACHRSHFCRAV